MTTFRDYSENELRVVGAELVSLFRNNWLNKAISTEQWTELVLDFFAASARPGVLVESRAPRLGPDAAPWRRGLRRRKHVAGEFCSFDMLHSTNPVPSPALQDYFTELLGRPFEVLLALESEWGVAADERRTRSQVLSDATKLSIIRARTKVMVFGPLDISQRDSLFAELDQLRRAASDSTPWLLVALPWFGGSSSPDLRLLTHQMP